MLRRLPRPGGVLADLDQPAAAASRTAELAGFTGAYAPTVEPDLAEWAYGDYEGITPRDPGALRPGLADLDRPDPGGESPEEMRARMDRLIAKIHAADVEQAILFGHGHALRALTVVWLGLDLAGRSAVRAAHRHHLRAVGGAGRADPGVVERAGARAGRLTRVRQPSCAIRRWTPALVRA